MISRDPPPRLADRDRWSLTFHDFVAQCLQKVFSHIWLPCDVSCLVAYKCIMTSLVIINFAQAMQQIQVV